MTVLLFPLWRGAGHRCSSLTRMVRRMVERPGCQTRSTGATPSTSPLLPAPKMAKGTAKIGVAPFVLPPRPEARPAEHAIVSAVVVASIAAAARFLPCRVRRLT